MTSRTKAELADERRRKALYYRETVSRTRIILFVVIAAACVLGRGVTGGQAQSTTKAAGGSGAGGGGGGAAGGGAAPPPSSSSPRPSMVPRPRVPPSVSSGRPPGHSANINAGRTGGDGAGGGRENDSGGSHSYPIATVDFIRVETPFIIALWIFCGSLAKIDNLNTFPCERGTQRNLTEFSIVAHKTMTVFSIDIDANFKKFEKHGIKLRSIFYEI
ncbi:unnamed protein product [Notodromas monacha]|uniref:Uncharacterized protein n=1 Tax=Notodromas monacha TaxID=399045 RepID=A0A7R9BBE9_9CRUS|nr:unnamed protein product [Notodromas monacha]CAG0912207.1 unnamed protein product [Notodromas monacha]